MVKTKRAPYLVLAGLEYPGGYGCLCSFCRYVEWDGGCKETYPICQHPLWRVQEDLSENAAEGDDCWGFRPLVSMETAYGMVYNFLNGKDCILPEELKLGRKG